MSSAIHGRAKGMELATTTRRSEIPGLERVRRVANQSRWNPLPLPSAPKIHRKDKQVKISEYKSYDDLPLFLNAAMVAKVLGVSPSSSYELMHEADFPVLKIGNRLVVPKEKFIQWVEQHTQGGISP